MPSAKHIPANTDSVLKDVYNRLLVNKSPKRFIAKVAKDMIDRKEYRSCLSTARRKGLAEGHAEGLAKGLAEGLAEGRAEGKDTALSAVALDMLANREPIDKIVQYTHLTKERVLELQKTQLGKNTK